MYQKIKGWMVTDLEGYQWKIYVPYSVRVCCVSVSCILRLLCILYWTERFGKSFHVPFCVMFMNYYRRNRKSCRAVTITNLNWSFLCVSLNMTKGRLSVDPVLDLETRIDWTNDRSIDVPAYVQKLHNRFYYLLL